MATATPSAANTENMKAVEITSGKEYERVVSFPYGKEPIGRGSFGVVRRCKFHHLDAAEKEISLTSNPRDKNSREVVAQVVKIWGSIKCPNIIKLYAAYFDETESRAKLVMEYIHNGSLRSFISQFADEGMEESLLHSLMLDIANAFNNIHSMKPPIIHRDIKSDNILIKKVGNRYTAKLSDFDFLRQVHSDTQIISSGGNMAFTAPELLSRSQRNIDSLRRDETKIDIYSLSFVYWEMADCSFLVSNNHEQLSFVAQCMRGIRPTNKPRFCSNEVWDIIKSCWDHQPQKRPTATALVSKIMDLCPNLNGSEMSSSIGNKPYIVLLGDVGTGKSTIVEKVTGVTGRSGDDSLSLTKAAQPLWARDNSLVLTDTPGSNALTEKLQHNMEIGAALNFAPVSRIMIVVKAETRIDTVISNVRTYAERLFDLPIDVAGVIVTHMDAVKWTKNQFMPLIENELGIDAVVFSGLNTDNKTLIKELCSVCKEKFDLKITSENFLKIFKIHNQTRKILQDTSREVSNFEAMKKAFDIQRKAYFGQDLIDLVFEFQAFMAENIIEAQKRLSEKNNFTLYGEGAANEAGHLANMTNQLRMILYQIRTEALGFLPDYGVSDLRKCPHCGEVWMKIEGCEGDTTCGNRPTKAFDSSGVFATFSFNWLGEKFRITKSGEKKAKKKTNGNLRYGCGKTINWKRMSTVPVPSELGETVKIGTDDVDMLPKTNGARNMKRKIENGLDEREKKMKLKKKKLNVSSRV